MNRFLKVFLCLALALLVSIPSLARDWYVHKGSGVDSPARDGSDSPTQWFNTINYAISRASSHDVIYVYGGVGDYTERVIIPTSKNNLTIRGKSASPKPVIDGTGLSSANQSFGIYVKSDNCKLINLIIRDFTAATNAGDFTSNNEGGVGIYADPGLSGTLIEGVEIYGCNWGIYFPENSRTTIVKSKIGGTGADAIVNIGVNGGVGIALWSNGTTIEKNLVGKLSDNTSGNEISYCSVDGIRLGYSTVAGGSADQTEIAYNTISNCGTGTNGFGINIQKITRTVNIKYNTIQECVNGIDINGPCLDLSVAENLFINVGNGVYGLTTNVLVRTSSTYDGIMLFDIWKRNKNEFLQNDPSSNLVNNSAASVEKTQNLVRTSSGTPAYRYIRNTIQSVWDNDVTTGHRLGVQGYNPSFPTVGSATSFQYYEDLDFSGINDVEIYGESDANPQYTQIIFSNQATCAGVGNPYGVQLSADDLEFHGFKVTGPTPLNDTYSVNIFVDGSNINIHHNIIEVQNPDNTFATKCLSYGISNEAYAAPGDAIVDGLMIHHNTFTHNQSVNGWGYAGVRIQHANNAENTGAGNIMIENNMFQGDLQYGVIAQQSGVTINENIFITDLAKSGDGNWNALEAYSAIVISDNVSSATQQDNINITCNIITGSASTKGFLVGMYLGAATDVQDLTVTVTSNVVENCYLGVYVGSAQQVGGAPGDNGVTIQNNDFGYDYDVTTPAGTFSNGALDNVSAITINATNNWWGTANGPRHVSNTYNIPLQGEKVFGNVTFVPWWGAAPTGTCPLTSTSTNVGPVTLRNSTTETLFSYHTSIQAAINAATATNGIIWATAGTYTENIDFNNPFVVSLKGKKLDGLTNAFTAGTAGADPTERAILEAADGTLPMVNIATDNLTIQGFEFTGNMTTPEDPTYVFWIDGSPVQNLTLQYNTILMGNSDYGIVLTDQNGLEDAVITYNKFVGESTNGNSDWFSIGDRSGTFFGGFAENVQLTYNDINYASAKFRLSSQGDIADITIENNTFNNVNGAIKVGRDNGDAPGLELLFNFNVLSNIFNNTSFANEFAFMLVNETQAADNFDAFDVTDLGGTGLLSEFTINYNLILYESTGLYKAVGIAGTTNDFGTSDFPTFGTYGQINARSNWWGSQYGPKVEAYTVALIQANFQNWWDDTGNGPINWPIQRSSWNQHLQGATCDNLFIDFHPWWQTVTGPDINGPIQVKNDNNTITTYPSFFDAIFSNACDGDGLWDIVSATSGTYTEDFGIWKDFVELRGVSDANPNAVVIKSTRAASTYPANYHNSIGLFIQNDDATVDNIRIRGITFEGPTPVSGNYSVLVFVNAPNVRIHNCEFRVPVSDNASYRSSAIRTHNELTEFSPNGSINGLYIHDNTFTHFGTLVGSYGYNGITINYEAGLGANSIRIFDNTFSGDLYTGIQVSAPGVTVRGNNLTSSVPAIYGIGVLDNYTSGATVLDNITISCNTITNTASTYNYGIWFPNTDLANPDYAAPIYVINNTIDKCGVGVQVADNADQISINYNNFNGTYTTFAVENTTTTALDATNNFWGSVYGPTHSSNAYGSPQGGAISNNVDYLPFWTNWINQCPGNAIGSPLYPVIVYDNLAHTTQIGVYASIHAAINDATTLPNYVVYAANGTFYENVTTQTQDNYLESAGTTTINGNFSLLNTADITVVSPYIVTGNLNFAGIGNQSSIIIQDADFEVIGNLNGASSPTSPPFNNYIATVGTGSFVKGGINSLDNNILPLHAGPGNYFFPVQLKVNQTGITGAKFKARVNGQNPAQFFGKGEVDNPVDNVWYIELFDNSWTPITNSNSDVYFYYPETGSWPLGFASVVGTEVNGCWSTSAVLASVFGARWTGTTWESRKGNSDAPGTAVCRVQQVNTFSPWGVFWGYSNAALEEPPTHADNLQFIGVSTSSLTIRVNRGSGERFMVVVKPGDQAPDCWTCYPGQPGEYPSDGEEYADAPYNVNTDPTDASWVYGYPLGSNPNPALRPRIVYVSPKNAIDLNREVTITGLAHGTKYYVQVIEFNGSGLSYPNYNVRGWCNLDLATAPNYNGRWRMTIPIVDLKFKVPPQDSQYEHHACNTWQDYFHITGSGDAPWTVKYTDGVTTWALSSPVQSFNPYFQAVVPTTESRTYSLVLVKDASERLCETTGYPELYIHTPTTYQSGNEVTVNPNPACNGTATVTFTPNVSGTDATFVKWTVNEGSGYYDLNNAGGTLGSGTSYTINTVTGVLTLYTPTTADNGFSFIVYYTGSSVCGQAAEVGSPAQVLTVNAGPNPGTISSVQTMPVCPGNAVTLNLTGVSADNWTWQISTNGGTTFNDIPGYVNVTTTSYIIPAGDVTEANSGQYVYRIIAYRAGCAPETTAVANYWTLQVIQSPANWPSNNANITVVSKSTNTMTITWDAVTGASYYRVNVWRVSTSSYFYTNLNATSNTITIGPPSTPLPDCEDFGFEVTAYNSCNNPNTMSNMQTFSSFCPTITLTPQNTCATAYNFGSVYVGATSTSTFQYALTGSSLSNNVSVTLPSSDFEIRASSNSGVNWTPDWTTSALSLDYVHLNNGGTWTIQVRFRPQAAGTYTCATITHSSSPATSKIQYVSGVGVDNSPTVQASNICFSNIDNQNDQNITISWTRGNGAGLIVVVSSDQTWESPGTTIYTAGNYIGSSNDYVAYVGTGTSVNINLASAGISAGQNFYVRAYEYNTDGVLNYYSVATNATNPNFPKFLVFTTQPSTGQNINSGANFTVVVQAQYRDGSVYVPSVNENVTISIYSGSGTLTTSPASPQISNSTGNTGNVTVTWTYGDGVLNAQLQVSSASCSWVSGLSNQFNIIPSTPTTQTRTMIVTGFANCSGGTVDVNLRWTNGNGMHRILVVRQGQGPATPSDGDYYYDANGNWADANKESIGGDNASWVVDRIDVNNPGGTYNATVSNLPGNTTFYFRVFDYNGNASGITRYNTNSASFNPIQRTTPACKAGAADFYVDAGDFKAQSFSRKVYLSWNTYIEQGILGYELYRADINSSDNYTLVGSYLSDRELQAGINSYSTRSYGFVDSDPMLIVGNEYHYRLMAVAIDGSKFDVAEQMVTISTIENPNAKFAVSNVNPNPATDEIRFELEMNAENAITVEVMDVAGRVVTSPINAKIYNAGKHFVTIPLGDIASGTYMLLISSGNDVVMHTFVVKK